MAQQSPLPPMQLVAQGEIQLEMRLETRKNT